MLKRILSEQNLPWLSAIIAALVALWVSFQTHGVINNDGTLYIEVAQLFEAGQWKTGFAAYNWPLYPLLIMLTHKLSGLDFQVSAHLLTLLFFAATGWGIATLIRELGGSRNAMLAGLTLLIATPYLVGDILPMVVRDHGYWACHIWSLIYLLRFLQTPSWRNAALWGTLAIAATLFRIEGLTYLLLAPLALLANTSRPWAYRLRDLLQAHVLLLAAGLLLALLVLLHPALNLEHLGRLREPVIILELVYQQITTGLANRADIIGQQALGNYLDDYGMPTLLLGMAYILLFKAATVVGLLQAGLAASVWGKIRSLMPRTSWQLLCWMFLLGLLNATVILVKGFILPKRILIPIGLVTIAMAAMAVPAMLDALSRRSRALRFAALALLGLLLLTQLTIALRPSPASISYERNAVEWVLREAAPGSKLFFESDRMAFYAGKRLHRTADWATVQEARWRNALAPLQSKTQLETTLHEMPSYDYLLFLVKNQDEQKLASLSTLFGQPVAQFEGPRGKRVLVFRNPRSGLTG